MRLTTRAMTAATMSLLLLAGCAAQSSGCLHVGWPTKHHGMTIWKGGHYAGHELQDLADATSDHGPAQRQIVALNRLEDAGKWIMLAGIVSGLPTILTAFARGDSGFDSLGQGMLGGTVSLVGLGATLMFSALANRNNGVNRYNQWAATHGCAP